MGRGHRREDFDAFDDDENDSDDFSNVIKAKEAAQEERKKTSADKKINSSIASMSNNAAEMSGLGSRASRVIDEEQRTQQSGHNSQSSGILSIGSSFSTSRTDSTLGASLASTSSLPTVEQPGTKRGLSATQPANTSTTKKRAAENTSEEELPAKKKKPTTFAKVSKPATLKLPSKSKTDVTPSGRAKALTPAQLKLVDAKTSKLTHDQYLEYVHQNGPVRGGSASKILAGMIFFYASDPNSKGLTTPETRGRIDLMLKNGARVVPKFELGLVTHVITDVSATMTAKALGYKDIKDAPLKTPILKYTWVTQSVNLRKPQDTFIGEKFLHRFPRNPARRVRGASSSSVATSPAPPPASDPFDSPVEESSAEEEDINVSIDKSEEQKPDIPVSKLDHWISIAREQQELEETGADIDGDEDENGDPDVVEHEGTDDEDSDGAVQVVQRAPNYACREVGNVGTDAGPNEDVIVQLRRMVKIYEALGGEDRWRALQTSKAIRSIQLYPKRISSEKEARSLKGVGEKTAKKIMQIINTGVMKRLEYEESSEASIVSKIFTGIYGVGPVLAREWYIRGLRTLDDVKQRKTGLKLSPAQELGLKHYDDLSQRMPRIEAKEIFEKIRAAAIEIDKKLILDIMGSYRRGQDTCGDIDILLTRPDSDGRSHGGVMHKLLPKLHELGILTDDLSSPHDLDDRETKYMGLCQLSPGSTIRRIDILTIPYEQWGAALLYFTGDDLFNRSMRLLARHLGYSLNQRGLFSGVIRDPKTKTKTSAGRIIASRTEKEIFDILKVPWQEPHQRRRLK